jgi:hypothetical protein
MSVVLPSRPILARVVVHHVVGDLSHRGTYAPRDAHCRAQSMADRLCQPDYHRPQEYPWASELGPNPPRISCCSVHAPLPAGPPILTRVPSLKVVRRMPLRDPLHHLDPSHPYHERTRQARAEAQHLHAVIRTLPASLLGGNTGIMDRAGLVGAGVDRSSDPGLQVPPRSWRLSPAGKVS